MALPHTIALTGATGFIGGALLRALLNEGLQIRALVRRTSRAVAAGPVEWIRGDLDDTECLRELTRGADAVIHCAGAVRGARRADFDLVNVAGVARLAAVAASYQPAPRFLLMSSLAAREPGLSFYASSKRDGEDALAGAAGPMGWAVLRPPAVYGPGDREVAPLFRWIGRGHAPLLSEADARFSLLYIDDLAAAVVAWLRDGGNERRAFELHDGRPGGYSWEDVVSIAERLLGRRIRRIPVPASLLRVAAGVNLVAARVLRYRPMLTPGKVCELRHRDWVCDNREIHQAIAWAPRVGLEEALRSGLGWGTISATRS
ncbi:MAG: NAD-dependent epimerase/dehydratase family protein [Gammaproteobacteria bacterium]